MNNPIASYKKTKEIVDTYDFFCKKRYGQNFLTDTHVIEKIIKCAEITKDDFIIEIGPGIGSLTEFLSMNAGRVCAVEIDEKLIPILEQTLSHCNNVDVLHGDILKIDIGEIIKASGYKSVKVVANLPYYVTTPIIMELLEKEYPISSITVMVQKEVAGRIAAKPHTSDYGALSLGIKYYADSYLAANVPRNCFFPRPNVDSAVIKFTLRQYSKDISPQEKELLFKLIKAAFSMRRKTLINCLAGIGSKEEIGGILASLNKSPTVRGEELDLDDFIALTKECMKKCTIS